MEHVCFSLSMYLHSTVVLMTRAFTQLTKALARADLHISLRSWHEHACVGINGRLYAEPDEIFFKRTPPPRGIPKVTSPEVPLKLLYIQIKFK